MTPGAVYAVSVSLKNTGTTAWTATGNYRLGSQNPQDGMTWGLNRVYLSSGESIAPGQSKTFQFNVTAPSTAGIYNFQWPMVQDGVEWFGEYTPNLQITVVTSTTTTISSTSTTTTTSSTTSSTSSSSSTTTSTTAPQCLMPGNAPACDEVTLSEVVDAINLWVEDDLGLASIIDLINSWADSVTYPPK